MKTSALPNDLTISYTYNELLQEFVYNSYIPGQQESTIRGIKAHFKRVTGYGVNEVVSAYNLQEVIDTLSCSKLPLCTFADWLKKWWKPVTASTTEAPILETPPEAELEVSYNEVMDGTVVITTPEETIAAVLDGLSEYRLVELHANNGQTEQLVSFYSYGGDDANRSVRIRTGYALAHNLPGTTHLVTLERQIAYIHYYAHVGYTLVHNPFSSSLCERLANTIRGSHISHSMLLATVYPPGSDYGAIKVFMGQGQASKETLTNLLDYLSENELPQGLGYHSPSGLFLQSVYYSLAGTRHKPHWCAGRPH